MDSKLESMMRAMLGDDTIALVERKNADDVNDVTIVDALPISRTAMKKRKRAEEKLEREKRMRGEDVQIVKVEYVDEVEDRFKAELMDEIEEIEEEIDCLEDEFSDDSEDIMGDIHSEQSESESAEPTTSSAPLNSNQRTPIVIVYEAVKPKPSLYGSVQQKRSFMSSKMTTLADITLPSTAIGVVRKKRPTPRIRHKEQDAEDDQHDKDLHDLLKTTKLLEQYTSADLTGRDRRSYLQSKITDVTKGKGVKGTNIIHPFAIREGIEVKRVKAVKERLVDAKERGLYSDKNKHLYRDTVKEEREKSKPGSKSGKKSSSGGGLTGSIGKYKDGTLRIGKKDIENASRGVKGNFGIVKRSFENVNRPKAKHGGKKNKKR